METLKLIQDNRKLILEISRKHGVKSVRLFGSVARNADTPASDIDLLVSMEEGRSLLDLIGFGQEVEELLKRKVDVISEGGLSPYLREKILAEAQPV